MDLARSRICRKEFCLENKGSLKHYVWNTSMSLETKMETLWNLALGPQASILATVIRTSYSLKLVPNKYQSCRPVKLAKQSATSPISPLTCFSPRAAAILLQREPLPPPPSPGCLQQLRLGSSPPPTCVQLLCRPPAPTRGRCRSPLQPYLAQQRKLL